MKISKLQLRNYRTLENIDLEFPSTYTAICGANDSGKTNVIRAIRSLMKAESTYVPFYLEPELSITDDFPKWKDTELLYRNTQLILHVSVHRERDAGLYQSVVKQLSLKNPGELLNFSVSITITAEKPQEHVNVNVGEQEYQGLEAQEILTRLQNSKSILLHNSAQAAPPIRFISGLGRLSEIPITHEDEEEFIRMKRTIDRSLSKLAKGRQKDLELLLGRLERKYKVGYSLPPPDFTYMPFNIALGDTKFETPLDDWGSGTKNKTLIITLLLTAKQTSESEASATKITPILIIEEPESFLHPSAQAEFGRLLQELAKEYDVQVIVTTHSPYMLNVNEPKANILLERKLYYKQLRETQCIDTSGDSWMEPFSQALGLKSEEFKPWKDLFISHTDTILLVEGSNDIKYFEMLRDSKHGDNQLKFPGKILSYGGKNSLKNNAILNIIKQMGKKIFLTYDLDAEKEIEDAIKTLGLRKKKSCYPIGIDKAGKRNIEGLLPENVIRAVINASPDIVQAATSSRTQENKIAKHRLKHLYFQEFKNQAIPGDEYFKSFYAIVKIINKAFS